MHFQFIPHFRCTITLVLSWWENGRCDEALSLNGGYFCFNVAKSFRIDGGSLLNGILLIICLPTATMMPPITQRSIIAHSGSYKSGFAGAGWVVVRLVKLAAEKSDVEFILKTMRSV